MVPLSLKPYYTAVFVYFCVVYLTMMSGPQDFMLSDGSIIVNNEFKRMWKWSWPNLSYYPGVLFLEGPSNTMEP
jgi:hypothetical protein